MWPALFLAAMVVGALSGGGAMLAMPALLYGGASHADAVARSLVLVASASGVAGLFHLHRRNVDLGLALRFGVVGAVGAFVVGRLSSGWPFAIGATAFGALGVFAALELARTERRVASASLPHELGTAAAVGGLSGWIGAGGGFLLVPLLSRRTTFERALGTSAVVLSAQATAGAIGHAGDSTLEPAVIGLDVVIGAVGAVVGLALARRIETSRLRALVAVVTAVLALSIAWTSGSPVLSLVLGAGPVLLRFAFRSLETPRPTLAPRDPSPRSQP